MRESLPYGEGLTRFRPRKESSALAESNTTHLPSASAIHVDRAGGAQARG